MIASVFRAPHSYTGEDVVEFSAHGSPLVLQQMIDRCLGAGARLAEAGEFTLRAFVNGKMDLTQAEAVAELISARAEKTHAAALSQLEGRLSQAIRGLRDEVLPLLAHVEVGLDHSDESHEFISRDHLNREIEKLQQTLQTILSTARMGKVLREGLRVAIVGRPNTGKSSLLNALLREERAIVTAIPGTTRDTLEELVHWGGLPVLLTDTAGLREQTQDPVERLGMERSHRAFEAADFAIVLVDASVALTAEDERVLALVRSKPHLIAANKSDLQATGSPLIPPGALPISAKTGEGLSTLMARVQAFALSQDVHSAEIQWLLNARHRAALNRALQALSSARQAATGENYEECVAMELKTTLDALGEIIGETTTDEILGQIFSKFCVGK